VVHGSVKRVLHLIEALLISAVVAAALGAWRLNQGPVDVDFVNPYIQEALSAGDGSFRVEVEHTKLAWAGWRRPLDLRATGVRVVTGDKGEVAAVPELSLSLSGQALAQGRIAPRSIEVYRARLRLFRDADGKVHWGMGSGEDAAPEPGSQPAEDDVVGRLVRQLTQPDPAGPLGPLVRVRLKDSELVVEDAVLGVNWVARDAGVLLQRSDDGASAELRLTVDAGGELTDVTARVSHRLMENDLKGELTFDNLRPEVFARISPELRPLAALELPLGGVVRGRFDLERGFRGASFEISGGAGMLRLPDPVDTDYPVATLHLRGEVAEQMRRVTIQDVFVDLGGPTATASALIDREADGTLVVKARAGADNVPTDDLPHYWPQTVGPKPRKWVVGNLTDGMVDHAEVAVSLRRSADGKITVDAVDGEILPRGVTVSYLRPMPPVRNTSARVRFDRTSFHIAPTAGELMGLRLTGGMVALTALDTNDEMASIDLKIEGPLPDALTALDSQPLGYTSKLGISPKNAKGQSATSLHLAFPLISWLRLDDVDVLATSELQDVALPKVLMGLDLSRGDLKLVVNAQGMDVTGPVRLGSIGAQLTWHEAFTAKADIRSRYRLQGTVDDAQRKELGLDVVPFIAPWLSGPVKADVDVAMKGAGTGTIAAKLDLGDAAMELPGLGWRKPAGAAGKGQVELRLARERLADIPRFRVDARDLSTEGSVAFADGKARTIKFNHLRYGRTDIAGNLTLRGDAGLDITMHGPAFDARMAMAEDAAEARPVVRGRGAEPAREPPPMTVTAKLDKLWLGDKAALEHVDLALERDGTDWRSARLEARLDGGKAMALSLQPSSEGRRRLSVTSDDAGAVFRAMDVFDNMRGGKLSLHGIVQGSGRNQVIDGKAEVANYKVVNAPALAQLLSVAALTGIADVMQGEGLKFNTLEAPFRLRDGLLRVDDAIAAGVELGLTARGEVDLRHDRLALEGTIVPVYAVNSMLGNLPVIGQLLTDSKGGGIFAATFTIKGPGSAPEVLVNPLAALTPGILRRFFDIFGGAGEARRPEGTRP
jgi:uncharacterized protein YhdP